MLQKFYSFRWFLILINIFIFSFHLASTFHIIIILEFICIIEQNSKTFKPDSLKSDAQYQLNVRVSPVALQFRSEMDPYRRDLTNILYSYLVSDSFGPMLGARAWLCKTANNYLGLSWLRNTSETFGERCLRMPPGLSMFYIAFLLYGLMGLTILDHIYSSFL